MLAWLTLFLTISKKTLIETLQTITLGLISTPPNSGFVDQSNALELS